MGFWAHHVATIVKVKNDWKVVDDFTGIVNVSDWIERIKREKNPKSTKPLMFFITRAGRFGHTNYNLYNSVDLFNLTTDLLPHYVSSEAKNKLKSSDFYKGFFLDFYEELGKKAQTIEKFSQIAYEEQETQLALIAEDTARIKAATKVSDVSEYHISQETTYCHNVENTVITNLAKESKHSKPQSQ